MAKWLKEYGAEDFRIYIADGSARRKLLSQGLILPERVSSLNIVDKAKEKNSYIYLSYNNVSKGVWGTEEYALHDWGNFMSALSSYGKVYANGGSEILR